MIGYVIVFSLIVMGLYYYLTEKVMKEKRFALPEALKKEEEKTKLSLVGGLKLIFSSKYLLSLAIMVVAYGLSINLIEVTWKAHLKQLYPNASDYQAFMSTLTTCVGVAALLTVLFIGGGCIRMFGWHFSSQLSPIIIGSTGLLFFFFVLLNKHFAIPTTFLFGLSPLAFLVFFGAFQNVISKVMKYSFFDPTKEMAFIPLDNESKIKVGLIDLLGTGSILSITHLLTPIIAASIFSWIVSVKYVNKEFVKKQKEASL
jgi:AAA family ATP:ADP antiporter